METRLGEKKDFDVARLLAGLDSIVRTELQKTPAMAIEHSPEVMRAFLEGFLADRNGSIV